MPLYEYRCMQCCQTFDLFKYMSQDSSKGKCPQCGKMVNKVFTVPALITDTSFGYTGEYDKRLGGPKVEGRKDWHDRMAAKGLSPMSQDELKNL